MSSKNKQPKVEANSLRQIPFWLRHTLAILALFCVVLYANSLLNGYNLDDTLVTNHHPLTSQGIKAIPQILQSPYYSDNMGYQYEYRPVVLITFAIEHQFFGDSPFVSHTINLLIYILLVWSIFKLFMLLTEGKYPFFILTVCALFSAFPLHTEAVCSIKNRDELLSALLGIYTAYLCLLSVQKRNYLYTLAAIVCFFIGMYTKQNILLFAPLIPVLLVGFTEAKPSRLFLIVTAIALIASLCSTLFFVGQKAALFFALLLFTAFLYLVKNPAPLWRALVWFQKKLQILAQYVISYIRHKTIQLALIGIALSGITVFLYLINPTLSLAVLFLLGAVILFFIKNEEKISWWIILFSSVVVTYSFSINWVIYPVIYTVIYLLLLTFHFQSGKRTRYVLAALLIAANTRPFLDHPMTILMGLILLTLTVSLAHRKMRPVLYVLAIIPGIIAVVDIFRKPESWLFQVVMASIYFSYLLIHFWKDKKGLWVKLRLVIFLLMASLFSFFYYQSVYIYSSSAVPTPVVEKLVQQPKEPIAEVIANVPKTPPPHTGFWNFYYLHAPKPVPFKNIDRPFSFVEMPLSASMSSDTLLGTAMEVCGQYLRLLAVPYPMSFYYGYSEIKPETVFSVPNILLLIFHFVLLAVAIYFFRKQTLISTALFIYLFGAFIYSDIVMPTAGMVSERFMLVPSLGFCIGLAYVLFKLFRLDLSVTPKTLNNIPNGIKYGLCLLLLIYSGLTFSRNMDWKDGLTLMRHDINYVPNSAQAHNMLATNLMQYAQDSIPPAEQQALKHEAVAHFRKALSIYPLFFNVAFDLGRAYTELNEPDSAIAAYQYALRLDSTYPVLYANLGSLYFDSEKYPQAINCFQRLIRLSPDDYEGYDKLSYIFYQMKNYPEAISVSRAAILRMPTVSNPYINLVTIYQAMGLPDSAYQNCERALRLFPKSQILNQLQQEMAAKKP